MEGKTEKLLYHLNRGRWATTNESLNVTRYYFANNDDIVATMSFFFLKLDKTVEHSNAQF